MNLKSFFWLITLIFLPATLLAGIRDTAHDFSKKNWSNGQICIVCHLSHKAKSSTLWNHKISTAQYTLQNSAYGTISEQPAQNNVSRFCLSCHDGTVPLDSYGEKVGTEMISKTIYGNGGLDFNFAHHGVGFIYNSALVWHLKDPSSPSGLGGTIAEDLLINGKVECISCHDIHNDLYRTPKGYNDCGLCHNYIK